MFNEKQYIKSQLVEFYEDIDHYNEVLEDVELRDNEKYIYNKFVNNEELTTDEERILYDMLVYHDVESLNNSDENSEEEINDTLKEMEKADRVKKTLVKCVKEYEQTKELPQFLQDAINPQKPEELKISSSLTDKEGVDHPVSIIIDIHEFEINSMIMSELSPRILLENEEFKSFIEENNIPLSDVQKETENNIELQKILVKVGLEEQLNNTVETLINSSYIDGYDLTKEEYARLLKNLNQETISHLYNTIDSKINPIKMSNITTEELFRTK